MLTEKQEKIIKKLHTKSGREKLGLCLIEGEKNIQEAKRFVEFIFTLQDTNQFEKLVTTEAPQEKAAVARIPEWTIDDITQYNRIVVLDGVQDPGNVGSIIRLCLAFDASLILIESADPTNPKVIRSSAGSIFQVPWLQIKRLEAVDTITKINWQTYRLEISKSAQSLQTIHKAKPAIIIAGSEGNGIQLPITAPALQISHSDKLESLNVAHAVAITLATLY